MFKKTFIFIALLLAALSVFLFNLFYDEAKNMAIVKLNEEQMIHVNQAARGIQDFFKGRLRNLAFLSKIDAIIANDGAGQKYMKLYYEAHQEQLRAITRLDEKGMIIYNFPQLESIGADISRQKHVLELLRDRRPVISDVFKTIDGFESVAVYVPVFKGTEFKGGVGLLINFEDLAKRYLDVIRLGETGYAGVLSREGVQLYSPVPEFVGQSVFENIKDFPSNLAIVEDMLKGHQGTAVYTFDRIGSRFVKPVRKYAVYRPVPIGNTFWSIAVASAEPDVLNGLALFRNKLALVIGIVFLCGIIFSGLGVKAFFIVKEEEKRKRLERKLLESESRLRDVLFSMVEWMWEVDENGVYTYSSPKGAEYFGDVIGKKMFDFMAPDEARRVAEIFSRIAASKAPIKDLESWNIRSNGEKVCLLTNGVPVLDEKGHLKGYRGVDKDITARKKYENETALLRFELTHLTRVMTMNELSTSLAHEINQPLGAILNNASAAKVLTSSSNERHDDLGEILTDIIQDAKRAGDVIRKIRGMVKKDEPQFEAVDMDALLRDVARFSQHSLDINNVSLDLDLQSDHARVRGDRTQLQQVVLNLVVNAIDSMKKKPFKKIRIRSRREEPDSVVVSLSDNGTGMDEEKKANLFKPFFTTKVDGLGMGLSICQSIVSEHGGRIWSENNPDEGATFSFSLNILQAGFAR